MRLNRTFLWTAFGVIAIVVLIWQIRDVYASSPRLHLEPIDADYAALAKYNDGQCQLKEAVANELADTLVLCRSQTASQIVARWRSMASVTIDKVSMIREELRIPQNTTVHDFTFKTSPPTKYYSTILDASAVKGLFIHVVGTYEISTDVVGGWKFQATEIQFSTDGSMIAYAFKFQTPCEGALWLSTDSRGLVAFLRTDTSSANVSNSL